MTDPPYFVSYRKFLWDRMFTAGYNVDYVGAIQAGEATDIDFRPG